MKLIESPNYINFKEFLFQVWCNQYTIGILIAIVKIYLFKKSLDAGLESILQHGVKLIQDYNSGVELVAEVHEKYAIIINNLVVHNINSIKTLTLTMILVTLNCLILIVRFIIELFLGTFICLLTEIIEGFINFATNLANTVLSMINTIIQASTVIIQRSLSNIGEAFDTIVSGINGISSFFGNSNLIDPSEFIQSINEAVSNLDNISIPNSVFQDIENLRNLVPDFDDVQDDAIDSLSTPISRLISQFNVSSHFQPVSLTALNTSISNSTVFNSSALDPALVERYIESVQSDVGKGFKIILIVLSILAVLVIIPLIFKEYRSWDRKYQLYIDVTHDKIAISHRQNNTPLSEFQFLNLLNLYSKSFIFYAKEWFPSLQNRILWFLSYISSPFTIFLLGFVMIGLLTILAQFLLFNVVKNRLNDFPIDRINQQLQASVATNRGFVLGATNRFIQLQETQLNEELFGSITNSSELFSNSINTFVRGLNDTLIEPFENTPFQSPISTVLYCVLTRKLEAISRGLEWLQENLQINIPPIPLSFAVTMNNLMENPRSNVTDDLRTFVRETVSLYRKTLFIELMIVVGVAGLFFAQVIIGVVLMGTKRNRVVSIGTPRPLTAHQKIEYGLPFDEY